MDLKTDRIERCERRDRGTHRRLGAPHALPQRIGDFGEEQVRHEKLVGRSSSRNAGVSCVSSMNHLTATLASTTKSLTARGLHE